MPSRSAKCVKCGKVVNDGAAVMRAASKSPDDLAAALVCGPCSGHRTDTAEGRAASMRRAADVDSSGGSTGFWAGVILERDVERQKSTEKSRRLSEMARAREAAEHRLRVSRAEAAGIGGWGRR